MGPEPRSESFMKKNKQMLIDQVHQEKLREIYSFRENRLNNWKDLKDEINSLMQNNCSNNNDLQDLLNHLNSRIFQHELITDKLNKMLSRSIQRNLKSIKELNNNEITMDNAVEEMEFNFKPFLNDESIISYQLYQNVQNDVKQLGRIIAKFQLKSNEKEQSIIQNDKKVANAKRQQVGEDLRPKMQSFLSSEMDKNINQMPQAVKSEVHQNLDNQTLKNLQELQNNTTKMIEYIKLQKQSQEEFGKRLEEQPKYKDKDEVKTNQKIIKNNLSQIDQMLQFLQIWEQQQNQESKLMKFVTQMIMVDKPLDEQSFKNASSDLNNMNSNESANVTNQLSLSFIEQEQLSDKDLDLEDTRQIRLTIIQIKKQIIEVSRSKITKSSKTKQQFLILKFISYIYLLFRPLNQIQSPKKQSIFIILFKSSYKIEQILNDFCLDNLLFATNQ